MTTSIQSVSSAQPYNSGRLVNQAISAEISSLSLPLVNLVTQYLFPEPKDWITEWTGAHGYEVVHDAVTKAETGLTRNTIGLVTQYLQKSDLFGLERLKTAARGKPELTKLLGNPEKPLPLDIDAEMQTPLSWYFDEETLKALPNTQKFTQLFSLYWGPKDMTPNLAEELGKEHGTRFAYFYQRQQHGNSPTSRDCWIAFPNDVVGRGKKVKEQEALIPAGFEFPHLQDATFCIFMKYACTGVRILSDSPWTYTRCQEEVEVGGFGARGLCVCRSFYDDVSRGVAPVRTFC